MGKRMEDLFFEREVVAFLKALQQCYKSTEKEEEAFGMVIDIANGYINMCRPTGGAKMVSEKQENITLAIEELKKYEPYDAEDEVTIGCIIDMLSNA